MADSSGAFEPSIRALASATEQHLKTRLHAGGVKILTPISDDLPWSPSFHYENAEYLTVGIEVSEAVYPQVLRLAYAELTTGTKPLRGVVVCPEERFLNEKNQGDVGKLRDHGFGLWSVDKAGLLTERFRGIPLNQVISEKTFGEAVSSYRRKTRERMRGAYEKFCQDPLSGIRDITEVAESVANGVVSKAVRNGLVLDGQQRRDGIAKQLDYILAAWNLGNRGRAEVSGLRSYLTKVRNKSHHAPENKRTALKRLQSIRQGFLEGVEVVGRLQNVFTSLH